MKTIYRITAAAPNRIAIIARPRGGDWLSDEVSALCWEGVDVLVSIQEECKECGVAAIRFLNLPVPDRSLPTDRDAFLRAVDELAHLVAEGRYVAVHCRAGIGRSSLLAASVLVRLGWGVDEAFAAIETARGCPVPDTPQQRHWVILNVPAPVTRS